MELSRIHPDAKIGENVTIESFSTIYQDVEIGDGTWIGPNVTIMDGARIGKNCKIFPGAVISAIPQDLKYKGEKTTAHIGDNTTIRECVTVNKGTIDKYKTVVGSNTLLMAYVHIAHDAIVGDRVIIANGVQIAGHINIDDGALIGGLSAVQQFCNIGKYAMIGGGSMVSVSVPPFVKVSRRPLSYIGINSIGLKRAGYSDEKIKNIQDIYRVIFVKPYAISEALKMVEENFEPNRERDEILHFFQNSNGGMIKKFYQTRSISE